MAAEQNELNRRADELYDQYAKPLEYEHRDEYIAVSPTGQVLLGDDLYDLTRQATETFGRGNFIFKLGQRAVGNWR
jgi:hypothetical protein